MVIRDHVSDDRFLVRMVHENILRVQKFRQTELVLGHVERVVQVVYGVRFGQFLELDQIWPVFVNDGVERQPVAPRSREIPHVHVMVTGGFHLAPEKKRVLRRFRFLIIRLLDRDILYLESQDYGPNEA